MQTLSRWEGRYLLREIVLAAVEAITGASSFFLNLLKLGVVIREYEKEQKLFLCVVVVLLRFNILYYSREIR